MKKTKKYYQSHNHITANAFDKIQNKIANHINVRSNYYCEQERQESYSFIPISTAYVTHQLITAYDHLIKKQKSFSSLQTTKSFPICDPLSFLDAGCGTGNIMLLAFCTGFCPAYGLEVDSAVIKIAKIINPLFRSIKKQNIMTYKEYGKYDVVYYYCPFCNKEKQTKFEERVEDQMKIGALLIANCKMSKKILKDKRFCKIESGVFEKITK